MTMQDTIEDSPFLCARCKLRVEGETDLARYLTACDAEDEKEKTCTICCGLLRKKNIVEDPPQCTQVNVNLTKVIQLREHLYKRLTKCSTLADLKHILRGLILSAPTARRSEDQQSNDKEGEGKTDTTVVPAGSGTIELIVDAPEEEETSCLFGPIRKKRRVEVRNIGHLLEQDDAALEQVLGMSIRQALIRTPPKLTTSITTEFLPFFVYGRYRKLSRELSQSVWVIKGAKKTESSVEEEITQCLRKHFNFETSKFHSAGREDLDVRMLGDGRPFVIELTKPDKDIASWGPDEWRRVEESLPVGKSPVEIRELTLTDKSCMEALRVGAEGHEKTYVALVHTAEPEACLDALQVKNLKIKQKTPLRVLHRRSNLVRDKEAIWMEARRLKPHFIELRIHTSAGTYIKEFVHGDFGRTNPSVSSLLKCECDILQLDVENVVDP